jgi:periplasmic divalent cation tolerance protein
MNRTDYILAYITCADELEATSIGRALVEQRLAACANIIPGMKSIYRWKGSVETAEEVVLIAKTEETLADKLTECVKSLHSYECPCIVITRIVPGNTAFFDWISESVGPR